MLFIGDTFQVRRYHSERVLPRDLRHHWVVTGGRGRGIIVYSMILCCPLSVSGYRFRFYTLFKYSLERRDTICVSLKYLFK